MRLARRAGGAVVGPSFFAVQLVDIVRADVELPKTYDPATVEAVRYALWESSGVFHEQPDPARPAFVISIPPPNITGAPHLGHGSTYTPMDILTRYHRMLGENAVWLPGQDHAAIATEAVVVRELAREGLTRDGLGRERFLERVWKWRERYGGQINATFRTLGFGPDWSRERFTMDDGLSAAVVRVFVTLYNEGLIYRGTRLVNWDPVSQSTLSDAEVEEDERDGALWHVRYPGTDGTFTIEIATTRPETMFGDVAIAVHPDDPRYRDLVGKTVVLPLVGRSIPIVTDTAIERDFGTGALKVTPAHDPADYDIGVRCGLPMPTVIDYDGRIVAAVWRDPQYDYTATPGGAQAWSDAAAAMAPYIGLPREEARRVVVRDLETAGALVRTEPRRHVVPVSSRSGAVVEPLLSLQWFCRMEPLAAPALAAYREGRLRFIPERHGRTYEQWLVNIKDWNVSRQVWWGHQLPVWYGPGGEQFVAETEAAAYAAARARLGEDVALVRDPDTLDTWFSSGIWPFSILGWPADTPELDHWYPNNVMITAREIIFLWVARMVMLGEHFMHAIPFGDVFITPLVFDAQGRKMSKSLKNGIDPNDLVAKYGADATRFGIVRQMRLESQELRFDERFCEKGRDFNNKMWNALRYVVQLPEGLPRAGTLPRPAELRLADRWILTRLHELVIAVSAALDRYEFGVAADLLIDFVWYRFCDWYIESTKIEEQRATRAAVLSYVLNTAVRLLHPIAPFVTEEIWLALPHDGATIVTASWPDADEIPADGEAAAAYEAVQRAVARIRDARTEFGLKSSDRVDVEVPRLGRDGARDAEVRALLAAHAIATVLPATAGDLATEDALDALVVRAPLGRMRERYRKELARLDDEVARLERKFANAAFTGKASPEVITKERGKLQAYESERMRVRSQLDALGDEPAA